jgi:hypothetical protein
MVLLRDVGQVETSFGPFGDSIRLDARKVTWIKWKLILVCLEIVLILALDGCMVYPECTVDMEIILCTPDGTPR